MAPPSYFVLKFLHEREELMDYSTWGRKVDMIRATSTYFHFTAFSGGAFTHGA